MNAILSAAIVVMSIVVIAGVLGPPTIVAFFASGFDAEKLESDDGSQSHHFSVYRICQPLGDRDRAC